MKSFVILLATVATLCLLCSAEEALSVELVGVDKSSLSEGPHWDEHKKCLYFVDIPEAKIARYVPDTGKYYRAKVAGYKHVTFIVPVDKHDDLFVIGADLSVTLVRWDGAAAEAAVVKELVKLTGRPPSDRFNDGKVEFRGRLVAGTMMEKEQMGPDNKELLISLDGNLTQSVLLANAGLSNGLAWNPECSRMYYCDSDKRTMTQYDYDLETGRIANPKILLDVAKEKYDFPDTSIPDGMTIDSEGLLYVALYNGSRVVQYDPSARRVIRDIMIPTDQVTSVAWGGDDLDQLYVTTGAEGLASDPNAGRLYVVKGIRNARGEPARGRVANKFAFRDDAMIAVGAGVGKIEENSRRGCS